MDKGDFAANVGVNFAWGIGVGGGVELMLGRVDIGGTIPITFGAAAKAGVGFGVYSNLGIAALATAHLSLTAFPQLPQFLQNIDWFVGLGAGIGLWNFHHFGIGIASGGGMSYYFSPNLALILESYYGYTFGSLGSFGIYDIGILLKL